MMYLGLQFIETFQRKNIFSLNVPLDSFLFVELHIIVLYLAEMLASLCIKTR